MTIYGGVMNDDMGVLPRYFQMQRDHCSHDRSPSPVTGGQEAELPVGVVQHPLVA